MSPLDANLPYADDFHATNDAVDGARGLNHRTTDTFTTSPSAPAAMTNEVLNNMTNNPGPGIGLEPLSAPASGGGNFNNPEGHGGIRGNAPYTTAEHEYNRILAEINEKHAEEEEINAILQDWKLLAQKVDYILFWVFLCLTTVSSCIFIFILPYFKRGKLL